VVVGDQTVTTDTLGRFSVAKVDSTVRVTVRAKNHVALSAAGPTASPYAMSLLVTPSQAMVAVTGNLTHKAIQANVMVGGKTIKTTKGTVTLYAVDANVTVSISAAGYDTKAVSLSGSTTRVELAAGPTLTGRFLLGRQIAQDYKSIADFTHSWELKFVSRSQIMKDFRKSDIDGFGLLSVTVRSTTILPSWRFPGCNGRGPKVFHQVATLAVSELFAAPNGGSTNEPGAFHLVREASRWKWFPAVTGCNG
jgi:hypothetical protein